MFARCVVCFCGARLAARRSRKRQTPYFSYFFFVPLAPAPLDVPAGFGRGNFWRGLDVAQQRIAVLLDDAEHHIRAGLKPAQLAENLRIDDPVLSVKMPRHGHRDGSAVHVNVRRCRLVAIQFRGLDGLERSALRSVIDLDAPYGRVGRSGCRIDQHNLAVFELPDRGGELRIGTIAPAESFLLGNANEITWSNRLASTSERLL